MPVLVAACTKTCTRPSLPVSESGLTLPFSSEKNNQPNLDTWNPLPMPSAHEGCLWTDGARRRCRFPFVCSSGIALLGRAGLPGRGDFPPCGT